MLTARHVPDEVWAALPGRSLPRARLSALLLALVALVVGGFALGQVGYLTPRISTELNGGGWDQQSHRFWTVSTITNEGEVATTIRSAAVDGNWLRLDGITSPDREMSGIAAPNALPITLEPHQSASLRFSFVVTDCARVHRVGQTMRVSATSPLRTAAVNVTPTGTRDPEAPESYSFEGEVDPWIVPWPGAYAAGACAVDLPPKQP